MLKSELRSFHAVATFRGFSAAARELNITQPTLSTQVKDLESRYNIQLFNRVGREVHLTNAGEELLAITSRLHQAEIDAETLLESFRGFHAGRLSIAAVGPFHATDMIVAFKSKYPAIDIEVWFGNSQRCFDRILSYDADVAILAEVQSDPRVTTQLYSTHQVVAFVNSDHPFYHKESISIADLHRQRVVRREVGSTTRLAIETETEKRGVVLDPILELGSREAIWKAVEQGIGIGFVADFEFVSHPNLRAIPLRDAKVETRYYLAHLKERGDSRLVQSFFKTALEAK
ncbi:LysR substrate-binding domain-containing protein [Ruegeria lacuscaerulensis]|uniref:LysR substrate-binding domain-containing protein n=1 Tax=Ruegeria lacuscaerulensis TaxID=55218 RepID=UPI00147CA01B|nr:LysR substrate-binding domain-containing protein [Ruegeria lacuscaerulensis]